MSGILDMCGLLKENVMNNIKNKFSSCTKLGGGLFLAVALLTLQGCTTMVAVLTANHDSAVGKVYRMQVTDKAGYLGKDGYETPKAGLRNLTHNYPYFNIYGGKATPEQAAPYRFTAVYTNGPWEGTTLVNNGPMNYAGAFIDDSVPLLKKGDLVDVYGHANPSMKDRRYYTIVRLVCMVEDKACAEREKGNWRRATGWVVQPKGQFDEHQVSITPHTDLNGDWLPGEQPMRPPVP